MHTLIEQSKEISLATTSGGTTFLLATGTDGGFVYAGEINMQGYEGVITRAKICNMPVSGGVLAVKLAGSNSSGTGQQDLAGTLVTVTDTTGNLIGASVVHNLYAPRHQFISVYYQRTVTGFAMVFSATLYRSRSRVVTQQISSSTAGGVAGGIIGLAAAAKIVNGPSSGTA